MWKRPAALWAGRWLKSWSKWQPRPERITPRAWTLPDREYDDMQDFSFDVHIFKEGDTYVAHVPALDVSSCGATDEEARRNIRDAVRGFLAASADMGTLADILREA